MGKATRLRGRDAGGSSPAFPPRLGTFSSDGGAFILGELFGAGLAASAAELDGGLILSLRHAGSITLSPEAA